MRKPKEKKKKKKKTTTTTTSLAVNDSSNNNGGGGGGGGWADLPNDLLSTVSNLLNSFIDFSASAAVCQSWHTLLRRPPLLAHPIVHKVPRSINLIDPFCVREPCDSLLSSKTLGRFVIGFSYGNFIFYHRASRFVVLANVFTGTEIHTPTLPESALAELGALTAPISSPKCNVLIHSGSILLVLQIKDTAWKEYSLGYGDLKLIQVEIYREQTFALNEDGRIFLLKFSPEFRMDQFSEWRPDIEQGMHFEPRLVKCDGTLMLVFVINKKEKPSSVRFEIYRLVMLASKGPIWERVTDLGGNSIFMNQSSWCCFSCPRPGKWGIYTRNCIYYAGNLPGAKKWIELYFDEEFKDIPCHKKKLSSTYLNRLYPMWVYSGPMFSF